MRYIPAVFDNEIRKQEYSQALLISIEIAGSALNFTTWNVPILHNSSLYFPRAFKIGPVSYSDTKIVSDVNVDIDDVDRGLFASFGENDAAKYPFELTWVVVDKFSREVSSLVIFVGYTDQWNYEPGKLSLVAVSFLNQWTRETTSRYSGSCRWRIFKGIECKYVGPATTCDRTYDQCEVFGNQDNFGGFRWLPSMINKKIEEK